MVQQQRQLQFFLKVFLILTTIYLLPLWMKAQTKQYDPDTVCVGTLDKVYGLTNVPSSSNLYWSLSDPTMGTIDTSIINNAADTIIEIDWGMTPGAVTLSVVEQTIDGCWGDTLNLDIYLNPLPTIALVGDSVCYDATSANLTFTFTGTAPWIFTYEVDGVSYTDTATTSPHYVTIPGPHQTTANVTVTGVSDFFCTGDVTGVPGSLIYVRPKPGTLSQIFHY